LNDVKLSDHSKSSIINILDEITIKTLTSAISGK